MGGVMGKRVADTVRMLGMDQWWMHTAEKHPGDNQAEPDDEAEEANRIDGSQPADAFVP